MVNVRKRCLIHSDKGYLLILQDSNAQLTGSTALASGFACRSSVIFLNLSDTVVLLYTCILKLVLCHIL